MVETTVLDVRTGQPALDHVRAAFQAGLHVVTANKGPIAHAYRQLWGEAERAGVQLFFEGTVMDGIPLFNLVRETLPAVAITGFEGIVNTTTQHILVEMERGREYAEALAAMQRAGIAEADPSLDVEGWDAAAKTAVLVNVLMGGRITPNQVERTGIAQLGRETVQAARTRGTRLRLVASAWTQDGQPKGRVRPEEVCEGDLLGSLGPLDNAIVLQTDLGGEIGIVQREGSLTHTAYAILTDLVAVARHASTAGPDPSHPS
jgi:homoserine dehydrogenase